MGLPQQSSGAAQVQRICDLSLRDFKKLSQSRPTSTQTSSSSSSGAASGTQSSTTQCSSQSAALTDAATQRAQHEQSHASAPSSAGAPGAALARYFNSDQGKRIHSPQAWAVSEEDPLPTLAEVFKVCCGGPAHTLIFWLSHAGGHTWS